MKVTSFEISRKLSLIDFERPLIGVASLYDAARGELIESLNEEEKTGETIAAYDLETILEALPVTFDHQGFATNLSMTKRNFGYTVNFTDKLPVWVFHESQKKGESLADTAARLLLLLHEKGLIKFKD